ncbi:alpha/beta fold hydrolase [Streptomyces ochraceiscleroticus]|uniref:Alpha/beta fold hydrolase n=2 Tax=Streptomyces ochraceiscleroticus TaxID=47761 RepID=A0ABW1MGZ9_9ACTN|nr:alpha/beta fold hydrolase [Streptomyces ochraceiscleroticus]
MFKALRGRLQRLGDLLGTKRPEDFADHRTHVVGHSLGGLIALRLRKAGLVRSVTALAPAGFWSEAERRYAFAVLNAVRRGTRILPDAVWDFSVTSTAEAAAGGRRAQALRSRYLSPELVADIRTMRDAVGFESVLQAGRLRGLFTGDIPDVLVTIAWGSRDGLLPQWQSNRVQALIPTARQVVLPSCGHVPFRQAPELVARVILDGSCPAASRSARATPGPLPRRA